jgi:hypothetical protein
MMAISASKMSTWMLAPHSSSVPHQARPSQSKTPTFSAKPTFEIQELTDAEIESPDVPEYLRIRGYRIINQGAKTFTITQPGKWIITPQGEVHSA